MFVLDRNGKYVDFHARDPKLLFVSPDAFLGRTIKDVMPATLADTFMNALERARTSDEPVVVDYELPMGTNSAISRRASCQPTTAAWSASSVT